MIDLRVYTVETNYDQSIIPPEVLNIGQGKNKVTQFPLFGPGLRILSYLGEDVTQVQTVVRAEHRVTCRLLSLISQRHVT